jgi:hypothetical protein
VVEEDSAVIDGTEKIGLAKTHQELQRVASREDANYKALLFWIRTQVKLAQEELATLATSIEGNQG